MKSSRFFSLYFVIKKKFLHLHSLKRDAVASHRINQADVAKLVDALDLGSSAVRLVGSSPIIRT